MLEIIRFLVVGFTAVIIDFTTYFALLKFLVFPTTLAKSLSFICGATFSFIGHRLFVFRAIQHVAKTQILAFILLYLLAFLINTFINEATFRLSGWHLLAWFVATSVSTVLNYTGMRFIVFKNESNITRSS